jgi:ABC-type multidrug transport system fused ATPase/permease subunit
MQDRTTLVIAHRLSTIQNADLIVALEQGHIVETGTHAELGHSGGVYQRLYELQFKTQTAP